LPWKDPERKRAYNRERQRIRYRDNPEAARLIRKRSYDLHRDKRIAYTRKWAADNPERYRAYQLLAKAKQRSASCSLNGKDIAEKIKAGVCEVTGLKFVLTKGPTPWAPSLDRIDSKLGYTPENTRVVVWLYNAAKNQFTDADLLVLAQAITSSEQREPCVDLNQSREHAGAGSVTAIADSLQFPLKENQ
jgi:hypothetical protein